MITEQTLTSLLLTSKHASCSRKTGWRTSSSEETRSVKRSGRNHRDVARWCVDCRFEASGLADYLQSGGATASVSLVRRQQGEQVLGRAHPTPVGTVSSQDAEFP